MQRWFSTILKVLSARTCKVTCHPRVPLFFMDKRLFHKSQFLRAIEYNLTCWMCNSRIHKATDLFCSSCKALQKPSLQVNHFELMGEDTSYDLDGSRLSKKYKSLQRFLHPDKYSQKSEKEQSIAEEYSSLVNKAYSTLKHPWLRGKYLLELRGIEFGEVTSFDDVQFLSQVMEINEEIAEAEISELKRIQEENTRQVDEVVELVSAAFKSQDLDAAKTYLIKLKYLNNISDKIKERLFDLGERL